MESVFVLLILSSVMLTVSWFINLEQLCMTSIKKKERIQRTVFAFLFCSVSIIINTIYYLSSLYSNYILFAHFKVTDLRNVFEGIAVLIGSHFYRIYLTSLYNQLYRPMAKTPPIIIQRTPVIVQWMIIIAAIICYSCDYILNQTIWLYLFYIILDGIILIVLLIFAYIWKKVLYFSSTINQTKPIRLVIGAMLIAVILGIADSIVIFISLDFIFDFTPWSYNEVLMGNIVYSLFIIMVNIPLFVWAYKKSECCTIDQDSVCLLCGCAGCCKIRNNRRFGRRNNNGVDTNSSLPILSEASDGNQAVIDGRRPTNTSNPPFNSPGNQTVLTIETIETGTSGTNCTRSDLRQFHTTNSASFTCMVNK